MCLLCACPQTENEHLKASVARLSAALAEKDRAAAAQAATLVAPGHPQSRPGPGDTLSPKAPTKGGGGRSSLVPRKAVANGPLGNSHNPGRTQSTLSPRMSSHKP